VGCIIQRINWVDVQGEIDHKNQISSSPLIKAKYMENDKNHDSNFMNTLGAFWIIIQVVPKILAICYKLKSFITTNKNQKNMIVSV
jgi:hypothetical protein